MGTRQAGSLLLPVPEPPLQPRRRRAVWDLRRVSVTGQATVIAVVAVACRLVPLLRGGGLGFYGRYDDGIYYAGADALTFGKLPYRDYLFLHPPAIAIILAPFAALGRLTTDHLGLAAARFTFMCIGALSAVLVFLIVRRWSAAGAWLAGLLYACWLPAIYSEQTVFLEPIGSCLTLAAIFLLTMRRPPTTGRLVTAGVALGAAISTKAWYVVPLATIAAWQAFDQRSLRSLLRTSGSALLTVAAVCGPFFVLAPTQMYDMVIRDQLLRGTTASQRLARLPSITGVNHFPAQSLLTALVAALILVAAIRCLRDRAGRLFTLILMANLATLLASPSYFGHYAAFTAGPAALVVGAGFGSFFRRPTHFTVVGFTALFSAVVLSGVVVMTLVGAKVPGKSFPRHRFANAAPAGCITADDPTALIEMNRLSRDFRGHCFVELDVSGITYDVLQLKNASGEAVGRARNPRWQQYIYGYLTSGKAFVIARPNRDRFAPQTVALLHPHRILARSGSLVMRE